MYRSLGSKRFLYSYRIYSRTTIATTEFDASLDSSRIVHIYRLFDRPNPTTRTEKKFLFNSTRLSKCYVLHSAPTVIKSKVVNFVIINLPRTTGARELRVGSLNAPKNRVFFTCIDHSDQRDFYTHTEFTHELP
ncbi:hypothetical protein PGB90_006461 [Kerria lacca]